MSFSQLRISSEILKGLKDLKLENPSPLQKKIVNAIKQGGDLLITASADENPETGYLVQVLDQISKQDRRQGTKAVILTTNDRTAELERWIEQVGRHAGIESAVIEENGDPSRQRSVLASGPGVIIATPSRLARLMEENRMIFREVQYLILDPADRMAEWDFVDTISRRIIGKCQRIAVVDHVLPDEERDNPLSGFLHDPERVESKADSAEKESAEELSALQRGEGNTQAEKGQPDHDRGEPATDSSEKTSAGAKPETAESGGEIGFPKDLVQYYIKVPPRMKITTLISHLENHPGESILIFTASRRTADRLYRVLRKSGRRAVSIHHNLDEATFKERFERFESGNVQHLVAGEIPASQLDIRQVDQVINYDVPEEVQEYRMRAELVGNGKANRMVSLVSRQDLDDIHDIINDLGYAPEEIPLPESVRSDRAEEEADGTARRRAAASRRSEFSGKREEAPAQSRESRSRERQQRQQPGTGRSTSGRGQGGRGKRPGRPHHPSSRPAVTEGPPVGLPRPSYDKLSGGRTGKSEKGGIFGFIKRLFS